MSPIPPPMTSRPNLVTMPSRLPNPWRTRPTFATIRVMPLRLTHLIQFFTFRYDGPGQNLIMPSQPPTTIRSLPHPASPPRQPNPFHYVSLRLSRPSIPRVHSNRLSVSSHVNFPTDYPIRVQFSQFKPTTHVATRSSNPFDDPRPVRPLRHSGPRSSNPDHADRPN